MFTDRRSVLQRMR